MRYDLLQQKRKMESKRKKRSLFLLNPQRILIISFIILISIGTVFLSFPIASKRNSLNLIDIIFTSTSAACVAGLTVLDTGKDFTRFGQIVILFLIQFGGIGIMTFSVLFYHIIGKGIPLKSNACIY